MGMGATRDDGCRAACSRFAVECGYDITCATSSEPSRATIAKAPAASTASLSARSSTTASVDEQFEQRRRNFGERRRSSDSTDQSAFATADRRTKAEVSVVGFGRNGILKRCQSVASKVRVIRVFMLTDAKHN
jgi:hypothetical protein